MCRYALFLQAQSRIFIVSKQFIWWGTMHCNILCHHAAPYMSALLALVCILWVGVVTSEIKMAVSLLMSSTYSF